jgi:hypothetical protein
MPFTQKTLNAFEMTCRMSACEVPAKYKGHRAFVGIYPPEPERQIRQWRITRFELPSDLIDRSFPQDAMIEWVSLHRDTLEEIEDILRSWGIASSIFDAPWKCDWPLSTRFASLQKRHSSVLTRHA